MMSGHYIERCIECDGVISQCRCPDADKRVIKKRLCERCEAHHKEKAENKQDGKAQQECPDTRMSRDEALQRTLASVTERDPYLVLIIGIASPKKSEIPKDAVDGAIVKYSTACCLDGETRERAYINLVMGLDQVGMRIAEQMLAEMMAGKMLIDEKKWSDK